MIVTVTHIWEAEEEEGRLHGDAPEEGAAAAVGRAAGGAGDHYGQLYWVWH